jgi:hypothetical protein
MMDRLEDDLRRALGRMDPPAGFPGRVNRAVAYRAQRNSWRRWTAAAAALLILTGSSMAYRRHQGRVAREQVLQAVQITAAKLNRIQTRVIEVRQ